jgi:hypothetical protein
MLVSFSASNFLSFKRAVEFTTRATRERQHSQRVFSHGESELKLVPIAAIFGGNASGKSNFYRAIQFLRRLVLRQPQAADEQIATEPFKLDDGISEATPSRFVIELLPENTVYRLTVAVARDGILEEQLEEIRGERAVLIYSRIRRLRSSETVWQVEALQRRTASAADRDFIAFKTRDTLPNQMFLGALRGKNVPLADEISCWFSEQLALMLPDSTFKRLEFNLPTTGGLLEFCNETLRTTDTGVFDIYPQHVSWQDFPAPPELKEEINKNLGERQMTFVLSPDGRRFSVTRRRGELHVARLFTHHKSANGKLVQFELSDESEGTQRFIDLLPAFYEMVRPGRPKVFVIDELDRSLHTQLAKHLVQSYLRVMDANSRSQLIFTTHDVTLLDQEMLRRDEIWFIEKDAAGASALFSLSSFEGVRYDKDIRRSYLEGNFGGIPRFGGPAFRSIGQPRKASGRGVAPELQLAESLAPADEYAIFDNAYPSTNSDKLACELALDILDSSDGISSRDHLNTLILATHPDLCRTLTPKKPMRKTLALFDSIRAEADAITTTGLKWAECISYLEHHRRALKVDRQKPAHPVFKGENFDALQHSFPPRHTALVLFALSVVWSLKDNKVSRAPSAEKANALKIFEQLGAQYAAI